MIDKQREPFIALINSATIKSHLAFVKKSGLSIAIVCFAFKIDEEDEKFEKAVVLLQEMTDFSPVLLCNESKIFTFLKDVHLHRAVQVAKNIEDALSKDCNFKIEYGALTIMDKDEAYEDLMQRLKRYMQKAQEFGEGKICYGTKKYDFCAKGGEEEIFKKFFSDQKKITLYNFYKGMPLSEDATVIGYSDKLLRLKTSLAKAAFLKNEPFTFLKHPLLPDTIKADIANTIPNRAEVILTNLRFIDKSPVDRENIRVLPDEEIKILVECADGTEVEGTIYSLAVNSIAVNFKNQNDIKRCFSDSDSHVMLEFELKDQNKNSIVLRVSAMLFSKDREQVVFSIYPSHFYKQKIESYIALQQSRLITIMQKMVLNFYQA